MTNMRMPLRMGGLLLAAFAGAAAPAAAQPADDYYDIGTGPVTIRMSNAGKRSFFSGPARVSRGAKLTIRNVSKPAKVGPHTFSLVRPKLIPRTKRQIRFCQLCRTIATAQKFDAKTMKINKPTLDVGGKGWNAPFGKVGDSWYVERKGASQTRRVTAKVGTTLTYFCAVHPRMKGTIKVVG